ncbi:MAG: hypothetical protein IPM96_12060 [Ignavibacteria bacterium]|nr:hypothetical protein [Ignavibacteria bacterium]
MNTSYKVIVKFILSAIIMFSVLNQANAVVRYITTSGAGLMNGTSWSNAIPGQFLQAAINASFTGDEVWVAEGIYFTTNTLNRNISFSMRNGVIIYGSFNGTETSVLQRVFSCGPTSVLSGEIGAPGNFDNSYHVISNISLNLSAVIDGFEIRGANDNRPVSFTNGLGGGIYNNGGNAGGFCSPTIRNCVITDNRAVFGGGIFNSGHSGGNSNPLILNCIISDNLAYDGGGGIDNFGVGGNASPVITNCIIYNNTANTAGGMYCWGGDPNGNSNPVILNSAFINNRALTGNAGGIICDNLNFNGIGSSGTSIPIIRNSIFRGNTAAVGGPQFYINGTASFIASYSNIDLTNQNPPHIISGPGTGNIDSDPMFLNASDPIGADSCWMTADDGLILLSGSVCIDAGDNSGTPLTDILLNPRIYNKTVDMGPYEFNNSGFFKLDLTINFEACQQTDTVIVELRNAVSPYGLIEKSAGVGGLGLPSQVSFANAVNGINYYITVKHRNSIETWSKSGGEVFTGGVLNYNFTSAASQSYGNNQVNYGGMWSIFTGDVNQDGVVDATDNGLIDNDAFNFVAGYTLTDLNCDSIVDAADAAYSDNNLLNFVSVLKP